MQRLLHGRRVRPRHVPRRVERQPPGGREDEEGLTHNYRIVGPDEFDLSQGLLSCDSPLGRALLGKIAGDTVYLKTPEGETEWYIHSITYE